VEVSSTESLAGAVLESDLSYYTRREAQERAAAARAVTAAARDRRLHLAGVYAMKARQSGATLRALA
jgi:hypothetical protein